MDFIFPLKTENRKLKTHLPALLLLAVLLPGWSTSAPCQKVLESQGLRFRFIPGGTYLLGSPAGEAGRYADETLPHQVSLASFYMAETETTNAQYGRFLAATGYKPPLYWEDKNLNAPSQPVVGVTREDAKAFCRWLTQVTGKEHRLPTEAQWEAAARGGLNGQPYPWGEAAPDAGGTIRANYRQDGLAGNPSGVTMPVGSFPPNGYGLYDMAGNVAEWCLDRYRPLDPKGVFAPGDLYLLKGGSWLSQARDLRCAARQFAPPSYADGYIGFRVVRLPSTPP